MKKLLLVLGMMICLMSITACSDNVEISKAEKEEMEAAVTESLETGTKSLVEGLVLAIEQGQQDQMGTDEFITEAVASYEAIMEDVGIYEEIVAIKTKMLEDQAIISVTVKGSKNEAIIELVADLNEQGATPTSLTSELYTMSDKMAIAGLNTLIGMGSVFTVLILISLIISSFSLINKMEERKAKEKDVLVIDNPIAQIIEKEEVELTDDLELVAVISAAIAASQGKTTTDGFVVRSIKRTNQNKWQKA